MPALWRAQGEAMNTVKWLLRVLALVLVIVTQAWVPLMIYAALVDDKDSQWVWDWLVNIIAPIDHALSSRA
jgi:hypothetical protein